MSDALAWAVLVPILGAVVCLVSGHAAERWIAGVTILGTLTPVSAVALGVVARGTVRHAVGGWGAPLGIDLRADGLAAVMLFAVAIVGALIGVGSIGRRSRRTRPRDRFFPLWFLAWAALNGLVLSADIFNMYVALELATLAAVGLIAIGRTREAIEAALRYLLFALAGSLGYLLGVAMLYGQYASLDLAILGARVAPTFATWTALVLMTLGLCLKAALFPLHAWLPAAYVNARYTTSALLAALIGKGPFYVVLRVWIEVMPAELESPAGHLLGLLGAAGVLWGSLLALRQRRLKPLIAYSSVAQIGYLFVIFPLGARAAWAGGAYLAVSHAAAKAAMFLAAGLIHRTIGRDDLDGLRGLAHHLPLTFFSLALSGISLMGMPPSGGFVAKWFVVRAALEQGHWWLAAVILVGGLLAAGYVFRILRGAFLPASDEVRFQPPPRGSEIIPLALALLALLLGVAPAGPLDLLELGPAP